MRKEKAVKGWTLPKPKQGGKLVVKQVRSEIGHPALHRRTLDAIGIRHHQDVVTVTDTPQMRGMLFQVRHLITVSQAEG
jgi:large subunit ribosomal protein L30